MPRARAKNREPNDRIFTCSHNTPQWAETHRERSGLYNSFVQSRYEDIVLWLCGPVGYLDKALWFRFCANGSKVVEVDLWALTTLVNLQHRGYVHVGGD
jgi:hypothetical protein